jgi:hypothetical protein
LLGVSVLIEGGAPGADSLANAWAKKRGVPFRTFPAKWLLYGRKRAGPIRNQQMLDEGVPDCVVAFPGWIGTADMMRRARAAGIPVFEVK